MRFASFLLLISSAFGATITASVSQTGTTVVSGAQSIPFNITLPGTVDGSPENIETLAFSLSGDFGDQCGDGSLGLCSGFLSDSASISTAAGVGVAVIGLSGSYSNVPFSSMVDPFADAAPAANPLSCPAVVPLSCALALPIGSYVLTVNLFDSFSGQNEGILSPGTEIVTGMVSGTGVASVPEPLTALLILACLPLLRSRKPIDGLHK